MWFIWCDLSQSTSPPPGGAICTDKSCSASQCACVCSISSDHKRTLWWFILCVLKLQQANIFMSLKKTCFIDLAEGKSDDGARTKAGFSCLCIIGALSSTLVRGPSLSKGAFHPELTAVERESPWLKSQMFTEAVIEISEQVWPRSHVPL